MAAPQRPELFPGLPVTEGMLVPTDRALPPIPLKHTDVRAGIIGPLVDVRVTQQFHNTHSRPVEALYVFPLPEDAAVTELTLTIGERVVHGVVREREQAQRDYAQARDAGQGAALLEQERPNLFTISVANIQPDEHIQVMLRFHDHVPYDDGVFEFVFPTVVLPRYVPPDLAETADARRVTATPLLPADMRDGHTLSLSVTLDAGKLQAISSPTHDIAIQPERGFSTVTLREAAAIPNKDFILRYRVAGDQFTAAAFTYRPADQPGTLLMLLTPRAELAPQDVLPREVLFVFDRSGSMSGESILQARNALHACLRALNPGDTFNIFPFDNHVEQFAAQALPFTQENVDRADAYIERIDARGGTEILQALQLALQQPRDAERLRVVVFMTDGAVGNEDQVLRELGYALNEARVYAFGIGSAVNRFLLDKLAEVGRGTVEYIFPGQAIEDAVQRFQNRAAFPVLVDLSIDWGGAQVTDVYPHPLPDLYAGQPLTVLARFHTAGTSQVKLQGRTPRGNYTQALEMEWPASTPDRSEHWSALTQVWARARIDALMNRERAEPQQQSKVREEILSLALAQHLLSPYTAFVAIEEQHHEGREQAERVLVPIHLPYGTRREAFEAPPTLGVAAASMGAGPMYRTLSAAAPSGRARSGGLLHRVSEAMSDMLGARDIPAAAPAPESFAASASAAPPAGMTKGRTEVTAAMRYEAALRYLARTQGVSGAWGESPLTTALVLLAFLRGGHSDRAGSFRPQLTRAVRWLADQAQRPGVAPVVAWALAELAAVTGAGAHTTARDAALAHAVPVDDLDQACLTLAQRTGQTVLESGTLAQLRDARNALELVLRVWNSREAAQTATNMLEQYQRLDSSAAGAVVPPAHSVDQPDGALFAATAAGAVVWGGLEMVS